MAKSTHPIAYTYNIDGNVVVIERVHYATAYARNGNVHNPTEYFKWNWRVEMLAGGIDPPTPPMLGHGSTRYDAYERARAAVLGIGYVNDERRKRYVNVRLWRDVMAEMKANYVGREDSERANGIAQHQHTGWGPIA